MIFLGFSGHICLGRNSAYLCELVNLEVSRALLDGSASGVARLKRGVILIGSRIAVGGKVIDRWIGMSPSVPEAMSFQIFVFGGKREQTCEF